MEDTFPASNLLKAALRAIEEKLETVMWNIYQKDYDSPFRNTGNKFSQPNIPFEVAAYSWLDEQQEWNFKWKDVHITWYKHMSRGTEVNQLLTNLKIEEMLNECLAALDNWEEEEYQKQLNQPCEV